MTKSGGRAIQAMEIAPANDSNVGYKSLACLVKEHLKSCRRGQRGKWYQVTARTTKLQAFTISDKEFGFYFKGKRRHYTILSRKSEIIQFYFKKITWASLHGCSNLASTEREKEESNSERVQKSFQNIQLQESQPKMNKRTCLKRSRAQLTLDTMNGVSSINTVCNLLWGQVASPEEKKETVGVHPGCVETRQK